MKNYKYLLKVLVLALLFATTVPSYAINFDEPRRVIIPQYTNAVYRDLTVLDKMYLNTGKNRTFLLEIGKRPTFFWNKDKMYYLYQAQELNFGSIVYGDSSTNQNVITIGNISLKNGTFASEGLFFAGDSIMQINRNSNILVNYKGDLPVNLTLSSNIVNYNIFARNFGYTQGGVVETAKPDIDNAYLRDIKFSGVNFHNPRMMIYDKGSFYQAKGTAQDFKLVSVSANKAPEAYYGPWELWGPSSDKKGVLYQENPSGGDPCGSTPNRCYHQNVSCGRGIDPGPGCNFQAPIYDTDDTEFVCRNKPFDGSTTGNYDYQIIDCVDYCYDYQVVKVGYGYDEALQRNYNNNKSFFEFKVEEVYQVENNYSVEHLVSQKPKTRVKTNSSGVETDILPISTLSSPGNWKILTHTVSSQRVYVDGSSYSIGDHIKALSDPTNNNPCFGICEGKLCQNNFMYIRDVTSRELKGGEEAGDSLWPTQEGPKQHLVIRTYTVGFCPKKRDDYNNYEDNFDSGASSGLIEAMLIKNNGNWVYPKVCLRRKVKCSSLSGKAHYSRHYQPLSTNYKEN